MTRRYSELITLPTFEERLRYVEVHDRVGRETFGENRYINQAFYRSYRWRQIRNKVIIRDLGNDLAMDGHQIFDRIYIHHLNPITQRNLENEDAIALDPEFLVCVSFATHEVIHYGSVDDYLLTSPIIRKPGDTWF